ncbi:peptidase M23, partial [Cyanobium sp. Copco_Reservoir_LC18]
MLPLITLRLDRATVFEDGPDSLVYTFTRTGDTSEPLTVRYSLRGTAALGSDFLGPNISGSSKTIRFAPGSSTAILVVRPLADTIVEGDETVSLTLASSSSYRRGTTTAVTGTISNDDVAPTVVPSITLSAPTVAIAEDGTANLVYTFSRTGSTSSALSVNYTVGGTATLGTDYTGISATGTTKTVTFAAGSATATVVVDPTADTTVEANETVVLTLSAGTGYSIGTTGAVTGTISNDDVAPTIVPSITLSAPTVAIAEDGTANLVYTFSRTGSTSSALSVNYTVGGTATLGTDYTGISATGTTKTVTFAAGSATATVVVDPTADTTVEANETVVLTLSAGTGYSIGTTGAVTGTISNDDVAPTVVPSITLSAPTAAIAEDGTANLVYTFSRTGSTSSVLSVNYTVGGTATLGTDYTGISATGTTKTVTFAAGSATATVVVDPTADTTVEANETVVLTLSAGTGYSIGTTGAVTGTISNDDVAPSSTGLFSENSAPTTFKSGFVDPTNYELGTQFVSNENGSVSALRYYRGPTDADDIDVRTLRLWRGNGTLLGSVVINSAPGAVGWQVGTLTSAVAITAGESYVVSYGYTFNNNSGARESYAISENYFSTSRADISSSLNEPTSFISGIAGVYSTSLGTLPTSIYNASNYWVDVAFSSSGTPPVPAVTLSLPTAAIAEDGTSNLVYTFSRTGSTSSALSVNYT